MSKKWAKDNGISPILYINHNSHLTNTLNDLRRDAQKNQKFNSLKILCFIKLYEGENYIKHEDGSPYSVNDYQYYNEREWRFIPELPDIND